MSVKTDTENKKGMLVFGQLPQTSAKEAAELEASCLKEAWSKKAWEDALEDKNAWVCGACGWMEGPNPGNSRNLGFNQGPFNG